MAWSIFKQGGGNDVAIAWAHQFLKRLGAPDTPGNVEFIYQWEKAEGGGGKFNPLNQGPVKGKPYLTTTGSQYGGGAADFASWDAGIEGAVDFLHYSHYKGVLDGLMNNNPVSARAALWQSPWAASHYGYGKNWPNVGLPGNAMSILPLPSGGNVTPGPMGTGNSSAEQDKCLIGFTNPTPSILGGGGYTCFFTKTNARALIGGWFIAAGGIIILAGVLRLAGPAFANSVGVTNAKKAVAFIPGGHVIAGISKAPVSTRTGLSRKEIVSEK